MYIQDNIQKWIDQYEPDEINPTFDCVHSSLLKGYGLTFGNLVVSIQWGRYNYCDHYIGNSIYTFVPTATYKGEYKKVREAEVAIICLDRFDSDQWGMTSHFVKFDEYENVKAYATVAEIEDIISVCADYARA